MAVGAMVSAPHGPTGEADGPPRHESAAADREPPQLFGGDSDTDPGARDNVWIRHRTSPFDAQLGSLDQVRPVVLAGDAEGLAQPSRSGAEEPRIVELAERPHLLQPLQWLGRPKEDCAPFPVPAGDDVHAVVHAIGDVHVEMSGRTEHHVGPGGPPPEGMARRIVLPVRLAFHDSSPKQASVSQCPDHVPAQQSPRHHKGRPSVERSGEYLPHTGKDVRVGCYGDERVPVLPRIGSGIMESVLGLVDAILIVAVSLVLGYLGNQRFEALERRLDRHEERTEVRFERVEQRFERVEQRFERVEQRFERVEQGFEGLEGRIDSVRADITRLALTLVPPREAEQS